MQVYHFHNGGGGGVLAVISNLIQYQPEGMVSQHIIYTINQQQHPQFEVPVIPGVASVTVFYYQPQWNFYYTCKQLAQLIPSDALLVAHDWLELAMVAMLGLPHPVVMMVHGDYAYYYDLAVKHQAQVNGYLCVAAPIESRLKTLLPQKAVHRIWFPVPDITFSPQPFHNTTLQLLFAGRCTPEKGYDILPLIDAALRKVGIAVQWFIAGEGAAAAAAQGIWLTDANVQFLGKLPAATLYRYMQQVHGLVLPSLAEGLPVVLVEAMKAGAIVLVNDLPGGVAEVVQAPERGFTIPQNEVNGYVAAIQYLLQHPEKAVAIQQAAHTYVQTYFDAHRNAAAIIALLQMYARSTQIRIPQKLYGSRLDQPWLPNFIVRLLRK
ncbi:glycosyltransferase family 4 protein [Ferruginibacter yonginensis]|uniref:Glycosyltransferase family 4 protein n=1 Tax=Ferruginibacter yonginensis TaxID=1310416 RepID=A0ABV8QNT2_9BACT